MLWRALKGLLVLDGERLSYRALDVEQIGSVYESMMGFEVQTTTGRCIGVRRRKNKTNLDLVFDLDALLDQPPAKRIKWLSERAELELRGAAAKALKSAATVDDVLAALGRRVSRYTPTVLPPGALFLQPGEERRRSGSHYTPRELTEPIVHTTLRPVLEALGPRPTPDRILDLKVCDPAMGSGAFLVEACRQLAEALVEAWDVHDCVPALPPDEDPLLHARRLVAQRCLYGVDKNPFAVNLAKLSLWLVTLARDHAFTFIDHALKHGDSLVGLTRQQIAAFHWKPPAGAQLDWIDRQLRRDLEEALGWRAEIQSLDEGDYDQRRAAWREAEGALHDARLIGDLCIAAFFGAEKKQGRETLRREHRERVDAWKTGEGDLLALRGVVEDLRGGERPVPALHWEIEFPEVFGLEDSGRERLCEPTERQWPGTSANVAFVFLALHKTRDPLAPPPAPHSLERNADRCNRGCDVFGSGFLLSQSEYSDWKQHHRESLPVIRPYIGGAEFNRSPRHEAERLIVDFREWDRQTASGVDAAFKWDVHLPAHALSQALGVDQINVVELGAPDSEGHPGHLHHVPSRKASRVRDCGWRCP